MSSESEHQQPSSVRRRVFIEDHTGRKSRETRLAANAKVSQLVPALVTALNFPVIDPR